MSSDGFSKVDLGCDIFLLEDTSMANGDRTFVFLDRLLLPCSLPDLSVDQIKVINRYRESIMERDEIGGRALNSREMFRSLIQTLKPNRVLEVGGGKFPVYLEEFVSSYCGVDVDDEAVSAMQSLGLMAHEPSSFVRLNSGSCVSTFDMIFGSFSFHFHFDDAFLEAIYRSMTPTTGLMLFNFISQDSLDIFAKLSFFCAKGLNLRVLKAPSFATREYLAIISSDTQLLRHEVFDRIEQGNTT
ncbi:hypothetical protein [Sulfitobacter geojensis]|uniref:hypothetical protein n=1 Tax=Sulfitobacter geojensis TaxID=1342299 RepID=UPI003B8B84C8